MGERLKKDILEMTFDLDRFFQPGYVIELCENTYYRGSRNQRALVGTLPQAERFPGMKAAERFIRRHLRCADWKVCICEVCWVLLLVESELEEPDFYWDGRQFSPDLEKALAFSSYRKILSCQKREHLQEASMIDLRIFPRKQITCWLYDGEKGETRMEQRNLKSIRGRIAVPLERSRTYAG